MFSEEHKKLLLDLFHIYAPSGNEKPLLDYIKNFLNLAKIPFEQDDNGNIICMNHKGAPLLSSHTDCVGGAEAGYYIDFVDIYPYGDDEIVKGIGNIGADDKCGVFLILLYLLTGKPINVIFSIEEEVGGLKGITQVLSEIKDNEVFKSIPYCLVLDRKNSGDIICNKNDYGTKDFEDALAKIGKKYNYEPALGSICDMNKIKEYMNGCNLSVGYYNPHSDKEFFSLKSLYNTWNYINDIIDNLPRDIPSKNDLVPVTPVPPVPQVQSKEKFVVVQDEV